MELTIQEQKDNKLTFTLQGVNTAYANTLRRLMMGEVPTMAIEKVVFEKNDSILYDEILSHRLGLVVLKTDLENYKLPTECSCDGAGCPQCQLKLKLSVEGPKTVYASDLKSDDPAVQPVYPKTILVKLLKGQKLEFEAIAILGNGNEHTKWSPGLIWYRNKENIKVNNRSKDLDAYKNKYPKQVFNDKGLIDAKKINTPELIDACKDVNPSIVNIEFEKDAFVFTVESFGALNPKTIVEKAIEIYDKEIKVFESLVKELK